MIRKNKIFIKNARMDISHDGYDLAHHLEDLLLSLIAKHPITEFNAEAWHAFARTIESRIATVLSQSAAKGGYDYDYMATSENVTCFDRGAKKLFDSYHEQMSIR